MTATEFCNKKRLIILELRKKFRYMSDDEFVDYIYYNSYPFSDWNEEHQLEMMKEYSNYFEELCKTSPDRAKEEAQTALIQTGVLNEDGSSKEEIVTEVHYGI